MSEGFTVRRLEEYARKKRQWERDSQSAKKISVAIYDENGNIHLKYFPSIETARIEAIKSSKEGLRVVVVEQYLDTDMY